MNLVVVFSKKKKQYAPIASGIVEASEKLGFKIKYHGDNLRGYKNIILFDNRIKRVKETTISDRGVNIGWWMCDYRAYEDLDYKEIPKSITHIFLCNTEQLDNYRKNFGKKTYYMPQCGYRFEEPKSFNRTLKNIIFIGSLYHPKYHTNRLDFLEPLRKYGVIHIFRDRTTYGMSLFYEKTPISLSISLPFRGYTSNRLYNILAAGGFCLSLYYPEIEKQFTNKEHLVWFNNKEELIELVEYYLKNRKERDKIAANGRKLFLEKHTAEHRIQNMYDIMTGKTEEFYGYKE